MDWKPIDIDSFDKFEAEISKLTKVNRKYVFRGHSDKRYVFEHSLSRLIRDTEELFKVSKSKAVERSSAKHERNLLKFFQSKAHLFVSTNLLPPRDSEFLEWYALMQHYGTPTRLLDVSYSPYVALFFALESGTKEASLFCVDTNSINTRNQKQVGEREGLKQKLVEGSDDEENPYLIIYEPYNHSQRSAVQQGAFIVPSSPALGIEEILEKYPKGVGVRMNLSPEIRIDGIRKLRLMNITHESLFPGLDGLCKSLKHLVIEPISTFGPEDFQK